MGDYRGKFELPTAKNRATLTYLCGHSLGAMPHEARAYLEQGMGDWSRLAVDGHFEGESPWFHLGESLQVAMGAIVGAAPQNVALAGSLTNSLHLLLVSFYRPTAKRTKILMEYGAFPSDRFCIRSHVATRGYDPDLHVIEVKGEGPLGVPTSEELLAAIQTHGDELATVLLPGVSYSTGGVYDIARITKAGRDAGAYVGWDLAHAVGNIELQLEADGADFAAWCTYKYLNGGPGSVGGHFVHPRHTNGSQEEDSSHRDSQYDGSPFGGSHRGGSQHSGHPTGLPRYEGWWGNHASTRFEANSSFEPSLGASAWALSNVPVFSMLPLYASLPMFAEVGMKRLAALAREGHQYVRRTLQAEHPRLQFVTPDDAHGAQLSLCIPERAEAVQVALQQVGVLCDTRGPNILRFAAAPLYNHREDLDRFMTALDPLLDRTEGS